MANKIMTQEAWQAYLETLTLGIPAGVQIIGLHGKAGAGKDTLAKGLRLNHGAHRMAFADPLREAVAKAFGVELEWFTDPDLKNLSLPYWGMTARAVMQQFGTEAMRATFGKDFWVRRWLKDLQQVPAFTLVVVTDVRETHEAETIRALGGVIVHLERPGAGLKGAEGSHSSEAGLPREPEDWQILNSGTVPELWELADSAVITLLGDRL